MKLFMREHVPFILYTIIQLFVVLLVYWYDGYNNLLTAIYAVFLGLFLMTGYLLYRYFSHQKMYKKLSTSPETLHESIEELDSTPLSIAIKNLLKTQYHYYQSQIKLWERKREEQVTFMNQWVHQMKTPLSVIRLITQDAYDERFESIAEEADQMRQGLEMVLNMARLETFEQDFQVDKVLLREIVNKLIHENKRSFLHNYVYPEINIPSNLIVETDTKWIKFILNQVIINAIKYSSGKREKVTISAFQKDEKIILRVQDRGIGIPKSDLPRVFQPFYTGENGRLFKESTGMGLYLAKEVSEKLNVSIELQSEFGSGTIVTIVFPNIKQGFI